MTIRPEYYKLVDKVPVVCEADETEWHDEARRVGYDTLEDGVIVSTVFLVLDHNFYEGPPILFETMVFNGPYDQTQVRYETWDEAVAGHAATLRMVMADD